MSEAVDQTMRIFSRYGPENCVCCDPRSAPFPKKSDNSVFHKSPTKLHLVLGQGLGAAHPAPSPQKAICHGGGGASSILTLTLLLAGDVRLPKSSVGLLALHRVVLPLIATVAF